MRLHPMLAMLLGVLSLTPAPTVSAQSSVRIVPRLGSVAGYVVDTDGRPLAGVPVVIPTAAARATTDAEGFFLLRGIASGRHQLFVRQIGFRPAVTDIDVEADRTLNLRIDLRRLAVELDPVVVQAYVLNELSGLVTDVYERPIPGAVIEIVGLGVKTETQDQGRFLLVDLAPGNYVLQIRALGYRVAQFGLRMLPQMERDLTFRLRTASLEDELQIPRAVEVANEANRRLGLRGGRAVVIGREQLERHGSAPLGVALAGTEAALVFNQVGGSCILLNGSEPLTIGSASRQSSRQSPGSGNLFNAGGWLGFFRADEVALIELYPEGSENSRTLCGRFPPSSGCSCPPEPSGIVLWLQR